MESWAAWLQWLIQGASYELMLFASAGILLFGLDDLLFDLLWLANPARAEPAPAKEPVAGPIAIFVPAWDERQVLAATLQRMLTAWSEEDIRLYVGCYPNDIATLFSITQMAARHPRLRLVIGEGEGPTTKGDNLNGLWTALGEDERAEGIRFAAIVLHDAEDHVHAAELALYRRYLTSHAMVQIPVVPLLTDGSRWIGGHYGDEFAEAHGKELALRSRLGLPIPSAGVGCALSRNALALLAIERGGQPFRADSLTEDYEVGMLIGTYGLSACFVDSATPDGDRIVSRGSFPVSVERAVRQKSRWMAGIALAGWDHLGWCSGRSVADPSRLRAWASRWMLWRDRRALLAAVVLLAAYLGFALTTLGWVGEAALGWAPGERNSAIRVMLVINAALLLWRLGMRSHFTVRCYGVRQGLLAVPRAFIANVIAMLAAQRAVFLYVRLLRSGQVVWEKTEHWDNDAVPMRKACAR